MKYHHLLTILACFLLYACPPRSTQQGEVNREADVVAQLSKSDECSTTVMVKDFTGMDGCRFLFVLDNGEKLLPNEMPIFDFKLADNQVVKIDYDVIRDGLSACMMESQIVKVNCITLVGQTGGVKPMKRACVKVDNYSESKWLKSMAQDMNPYMITRFSFKTDGWAYLIDNGREKKLIDCQGTVICTALGKALSECTKKIKNLGEGKVIHATKPPRQD